MKKNTYCRRSEFIGHNLAIKLRKKFKVAMVDGLEVNNLTSIISNSDNLPNPRLSREVIDSRLELINKYKIPFLCKMQGLSQVIKNNFNFQTGYISSSSCNFTFK